jgi:hypothetical protein
VVTTIEPKAMISREDHDAKHSSHDFTSQSYDRTEESLDPEG